MMMEEQYDSDFEAEMESRNTRDVNNYHVEQENSAADDRLVVEDFRELSDVGVEAEERGKNAQIVTSLDTVGEGESDIPVTYEKEEELTDVGKDKAGLSEWADENEQRGESDEFHTTMACEEELKDDVQEERVIEGQDEDTTVDDVIDPDTTLAIQQAEKDAMLGLISSNVVLERENENMKTKVTEMEEKCHDFEKTVEELKTENTEQRDRIAALEDELARAKLDDESKKAVEASNERADDLERQLKQLAEDHEESQRSRIRAMDLEGLAGHSPRRSKTCVIL